MQTLRAYDEQLYAVADALSYYELSDYGCGEQRPLNEEQEEHRRMIREFQEQVNARLEVMNA